MTRHIQPAAHINTDVELAVFFGSGLTETNKIVSINEFRKFWESLNTEEKHYYRTVELV